MVSEKESTFLGMKSTLSDGNLNKSTFLVVGSSLVVPWFVLGSYLSFGSNDFFILGLLHGRDKDGTREGNLSKTHFLVTRSSVGVFSVVSRSSVGKIRQGIREVKETAILIKSTF